jgi:hypothetical protein
MHSTNFSFKTSALKKMKNESKMRSNVKWDGKKIDLTSNMAA